MVAKPVTVESAGPRSHPRMWIIECHTCAFEPDNQITRPRDRCPKCHGYAWHRVPNPRALVETAGVKPALARHHQFPGLHAGPVWGKTG